MPELRDCHVVHWIDNRGCIAALIKGYSTAPDNLNMLHAFSAFRLGRGLDIWFEWVASKANIADLPSRLEYTRLRALGSQEVPFIFPPFRAWDEPVEEWLHAGLAAPVRPPPERMGRVTVSNIKTASQREGDIRVDRSSASPLQNPYPMRDAISRERVCVAAARLIEGPLAASDDAVAVVALDMCLPCAPGSDDPSAQRDRREAMEALAARVAHGVDVRLLCWCAPARCHADEISRVVRARAETLWRAMPGKRRKR